MKYRVGRTRSGVLLAMLAAAALLLSGCTSAADGNLSGPTQIATPFTAEIADRLSAALTDAITLSGSSGAIAGVWAPWAGQWLVSPGTTTRDGKEPLTTGMRFRIAANTTSMTCTVLLKLVDEGRVKLSDPVTMYLTRVVGVENITLGQLCQGTSGLADYRAELWPQFVNNPTREWPPLEVVSSGMAAARTAEPGGAWARSDTALILLGMTLQAATGRDWSTLYREYLFDPLGMDATSYPDSSDLSIPGPHPHGYAAALNPAGQLVCETERDETELSNSMSGVAGGVVSTVGDLKTWVQALAEGRLLSKASAAAQWSTVPLGGASASWQSYGLGAEQVGPLRGNAGAIPGYLSATFADPSSGLTVVVMLNNSNAGAGFAQDLAERLVSIASTVPASGKEPAPALALPWTEDQTVQAMQAAAVCPPPVAPAG